MRSAAQRERLTRQRALKLVATQVPAICAGWQNPLATHYEVHSEGVHTLADDESSDVAMDMLTAIDA